jgi:hypothetical protein
MSTTHNFSTLHIVLTHDVGTLDVPLALLLTLGHLLSDPECWIRHLIEVGDLLVGNVAEGARLSAGIAQFPWPQSSFDDRRRNGGRMASNRIRDQAEPKRPRPAGSRRGRTARHLPTVQTVVRFGMPPTLCIPAISIRSQALSAAVLTEKNYAAPDIS